MAAKPLLRDEITEKLRRLVAKNQGDKPVRIEAERELARRFHVSRISLRAAIQNLADEGLISRRQGSGTYVLPRKGISVVHLLLAPDIKSEDPFYIALVGELSRRLAASSIHLVIVGAGRQPAARSDAPLIIVGKVQRPLLRVLRRSYSSIVSTFSYGTSAGLSQIGYDDREIGREAARILYARGIATLIHLAGPERYRSSVHRRQGFLRACDDLGVRPRIIEGKMNWRSGYVLGETVAQIKKRTSEPVGVFAANDWMAIGLLQRLSELRMAIPQDISIIGCDNIPLSSEISPQLATFELDMEQLVTELFALVDDLMNGKRVREKRVLLRARFIDRETLRPSRNGDGAATPPRRQRPTSQEAKTTIALL